MEHLREEGYRAERRAVSLEGWHERLHVRMTSGWASRWADSRSIFSDPDLQQNRGEPEKDTDSRPPPPIG